MQTLRPEFSLARQLKDLDKQLVAVNLSQTKRTLKIFNIFQYQLNLLCQKRGLYAKLFSFLQSSKSISSKSKEMNHCKLLQKESTKYIHYLRIHGHKSACKK